MENTKDQKLKKVEAPGTIDERAQIHYERGLGKFGRMSCGYGDSRYKAILDCPALNPDHPLNKSDAETRKNRETDCLTLKEGWNNLGQAISSIFSF